MQQDLILFRRLLSLIPSTDLTITALAVSAGGALPFKEVPI